MEIRAPIKVFCCYARIDQQLFFQLQKHLQPFQREGLITLWADTNIDAGTEWEKELHHHLNTAQFVLLLISPDFLASEYCYTEMQQAMERQKCGEAHVIPILLRPVIWRDAPFAKLQILPTNTIPIISEDWHNWDEVFLNVSKGLRNSLETYLAKQEKFLYVEGSENARLLEEEQVPFPKRDPLLRYRSDHTRKEGLVVWDNTQMRYIIRLADSLLKLKRHSSLGTPLPGPYRFSYLAEARILLSEDPMCNAALVASYLSVVPGITHEEQALQLYQKAFCDIFEFSLNDLADNRQGLLSDKQLQRLLKENTKSVVWFVFRLLALFGSSLALVFVSSGVGNVLAWVNLLLVILAIVEALRSSSEHQSIYTAILSRKRVESITGEIRTRVEMDPIKQRGDTEVYDYYYDIGGKSFEVAKNSCNALFPTICYRLYYVSTEIVSIEPLKAPKH